MENLRIENAIVGGHVTVTEVLSEDAEVTAVWQIDGETYWEDPEAGTVRTGTLDDFMRWFVTKTA